MEIHPAFRGQFSSRYYMQKSQHLRILYQNDETENQICDMKKLLTFEFCFTVEIYWKHRVKRAKEIAWEKIISGKLDPGIPVKRDETFFT